MLPQHHNNQQQPLSPQHTPSDYSPSSHSSSPCSSSSNTRLSTISTRQEYVQKEMESTLHIFGSQPNSLRNPRNEPRPDLHLPEPWHTGMLLGNTTTIKKKLSSDSNESAYSDTQSTRFQPQSIQDNSRGRTNKRKRDETPNNTQTTCFPDNMGATPFSSHASNHALSSAPLRLAGNGSTDVLQSLSFNGGYPSNAPPPALLLLDADLWTQFHEQHNEMIITKSGRCVFPCLRFKAVNLDPNAYYSVRLDFEMLTPNRFRFHNGLWKPVEPLKHADGQSSGDIDSQESAEPTGSNSNLLRESYIHPDRFQLGSYWMANPISFAKVKLTNKIESQSSIAKRAANRHFDMGGFAGSHSGQSMKGANSVNTNVFHLTSFHKYCPRISLMQRRKDSDAILTSTTYRFDRTEFMAVTHYQNYKVNDLKKSHNPHAKGFRGTIGKVLPPVKLPAGQPQQHNHHTFAKHSPLNVLGVRSKRARINWRSEKSDSDGAIIDDVDGESEGEDSAGAAPSVGMSSSRKTNEAMIGVVSGTGTSPADARRSGKKASLTCRRAKEKNTLIATSLDKEQQSGGKVSERTNNHYFNQPAPWGGEVVGTPDHRPRLATGEATWRGQQAFSLVSPNTSDERIERSTYIGRINQPALQYQHEQHGKTQFSLVTGHGNETSDLDSRQANLPLHPLLFGRSPTVNLDRTPTRITDDNSNPSNSPSILGPSYMSPMTSGRDDVYIGASVAAYDAATDLLQIHQSAPELLLESIERKIISDQDILQDPSTDLAVAAGDSTTGALSMNTAPPPPTLSWYQQFLWDLHTTNVVQDASDTTATPYPF